MFVGSPSVPEDVVAARRGPALYVMTIGDFRDLHRYVVTVGDFQDLHRYVATVVTREDYNCGATVVGQGTMQ